MGLVTSELLSFPGAKGQGEGKLENPVRNLTHRISHLEKINDFLLRNIASLRRLFTESWYPSLLKSPAWTPHWPNLVGNQNAKEPTDNSYRLA